MKNLFKLLSLSVLAAFIALGCSNTSGDAVSLGNGETSAKTATKTITLVATGDAEAIKFPTAGSSGISATIVADALTATNLNYYLFTTPLVGGGTIDPKGPLTFTAPDASKPNVGTVPLSIPDGYYKFKLWATVAPVASGYNEETVKNAAVFVGETEADLRTSTDTVTFYLSSDAVPGSADVALKLMTTGWTVPAGHSITAAMTKKTNGDIVGTADWMSIASITNTAPGSAQYNASGAPAGTYNFEVRFKNDTTQKTYTWSDTIIVTANHNIAKTIEIPEIIDLPPAAPTDFNATFKDSTTTSAGDYNVEFSWKAVSSVNEAYFQIELLEIPVNTAWSDIDDDTQTPWTDAYRTTLGNSGGSYVTTLGADFYGNKAKKWVDGSLRKNNTKAVVALPLGKRYLARIAAVNDSGPSAYCYVKFDNDQVPGTLTPGYSKFSADSKVINRYRLTYNLAGGVVDVDGNQANEIKKDIVEYRTQNEEANGTAGTYKAAAITSDADVLTADIWNPTTDTTTYLSLKKGTQAWTAWRQNSTSGVYYGVAPSYDPPDYTGCENLVLCASYSPTNAGVNLLEHSEWNIGVDNFTGTAPTGTGVTTTALAAKSEISMDLGTAGAGSIAWTGAYTAAQKAAGVTWTKAEYTIKKTGQSYNIAGPVSCGTIDANGFTVTTNLSTYVEGVYLVTFSAYVSFREEPYTYTVVVKITSN